MAHSANGTSAADLAIQNLMTQGFEVVHTELDWQSPHPKRGTADIRGVPHYFFLDSTRGEFEGTYSVWPISAELLGLEKSNYNAVLRWRRQVAEGGATIEDHPAYGPLDSRYNQIREHTHCHRLVPSGGAKRMVAEWRTVNDLSPVDGCRMMRWSDA